MTILFQDLLTFSNDFDDKTSNFGVFIYENIFWPKIAQNGQCAKLK